MIVIDKMSTSRNLLVLKRFKFFFLDLIDLFALKLVMSTGQFTVTVLCCLEFSTASVSCVSLCHLNLAQCPTFLN